MSSLKNQIAATENEELALARRKLLGKPIITLSNDASTFAIIRRRIEPLQTWFDFFCGWRLECDPRAGYARLFKVGINDPTHPALTHRTNRSPFDRTRYVLLCMTVAELISTQVITIGHLAQRVRHSCTLDAQLPSFDTEVRAQRVAFVDVLALLRSLGIVELVDGVTESFEASAEAPVLFRVDTTAAIRLLVTARGASQLESPEGWTDIDFSAVMNHLQTEPRYGVAGRSETQEQTTAQRNLMLRHRMMRKLLNEPVVYRADLDPATLEYASSPGGRQLIRRCAEQAGFELEERLEGWMFIDPDGISSDWLFPEAGANAKVAALRMLDVLAARPVEEGMSHEEILRFAIELLASDPQWAMSYRSDDGPTRLVQDAVAINEAMGLVARGRTGRVYLLPAAGRYQIESQITTDPLETRS